MNSVSKKLCLALVSTAAIFTGCSKKPMRPDPSMTAIGPQGGGGSSIRRPFRRPRMPIPACRPRRLRRQWPAARRGRPGLFRDRQVLHQDGRAREARRREGLPRQEPPVSPAPRGPLRLARHGGIQPRAGRSPGQRGQEISPHPRGERGQAGDPLQGQRRRQQGERRRLDGRRIAGSNWWCSKRPIRLWLARTRASARPADEGLCPFGQLPPGNLAARIFSVVALPLLITSRLKLSFGAWRLSSGRKSPNMTESSPVTRLMSAMIGTLPPSRR